MNRLVSFALLGAVATLAACATTERMSPGKPGYMVVGIDNKVTWGADGKIQFSAPGKDSLTIVDIGTDPANPKIVASLPLMNSIFGPPTNLSITPNGDISVLRVDGETITNTGTLVKLPGKPASMRGRTM